jgi:hypothetical protein
MKLTPLDTRISQPFLTNVCLALSTQSREWSMRKCSAPPVTGRILVSDVHRAARPGTAADRASNGIGKGTAAFVARRRSLPLSFRGCHPDKRNKNTTQPRTKSNHCFSKMRCTNRLWQGKCRWDRNPLVVRANVRTGDRGTIRNTTLLLATCRFHQVRRSRSASSTCLIFPATRCRLATGRLHRMLPGNSMSWNRVLSHR